MSFAVRRGIRAGTCFESVPPCWCTCTDVRWPFCLLFRFPCQVHLAEETAGKEAFSQTHWTENITFLSSNNVALCPLPLWIGLEPVRWGGLFPTFLTLRLWPTLMPSLLVLWVRSCRSDRRCVSTKAFTGCSARNYLLIHIKTSRMSDVYYGWKAFFFFFDPPHSLAWFVKIVITSGWKVGRPWLSAALLSSMPVLHMCKSA